MNSVSWLKITYLNKTEYQNSTSIKNEILLKTINATNFERLYKYITVDNKQTDGSIDKQTDPEMGLSAGLSMVHCKLTTVENLKADVSSISRCKIALTKG